MLQMKKNVLLIFGGPTDEYLASCESAATVLNAISDEKYWVYCVGISTDGKWILTNAKTEEILDQKTWLKNNENKNVILSPEKGQGLLLLESEHYDLIPIDVAFPVIPGEFGEDGKLPGLFEMAGIPYVGSGLCASVCSLDKIITKMFADDCGIKRTEMFICDKNELCRASESVADDCIHFFQTKTGHIFPLIVKPVTGGSSVGISKVFDRSELIRAMERALRYSQQAIVEEYIESSDLSVGILEYKGNFIISDIVKIDVGKGNFFSAEDKETGRYAKHIPAPIPQETAAYVKQQALEIYKKIGCRDYARVDFLMAEKDGKIYFNEINTIPAIGLDTHTYPLLFQSKGITIENIIDILIENAFMRK